MTTLPDGIVIRDRTRRVEAEIGVTPQMVEEVVKLLYEKHRDGDFPDWPTFIDRARKRPSLWHQYFDFEAWENFSQFGEDASKVRAVMRVAAMIFAPPPTSSGRAA
jgi:hypothetical protein